jgi:hypothetical protein
MINKNDLHIGQVVEWTGIHQKGIKGKITHLHDKHFTIEWSDGEITDDKYEDNHQLKIHPTSKVKTLKRSDIEELLLKMYKLGWKDYENNGPFIATNRVKEIMEKYL